MRLSISQDAWLSCCFSLCSFVKERGHLLILISARDSSDVARERKEHCIDWSSRQVPLLLANTTSKLSTLNEAERVSDELKRSQAMDKIISMIIGMMVANIFKVFGMPVFRDMVVHESRVKAGSQITLLGTSNEHQSKDKVIHWFKDKRPIPFESTPKYIFFNAGEILVINEFMSEDIGQYVCIFSNNSTLKGTVFKLSLLPPSESSWYGEHSSTVGTVTGMTFLLLIMLALVFYCCNKESDLALPPPYLKQCFNAHHLQNNVLSEFNQSGVKFSSDIHFARKTGSPSKSYRQVRQESIVALGAESKQTIDRLKKMKASRRDS